MKNLLLVLGLVLFGINANASIFIKSVELLDSTEIDGTSIVELTVTDDGNVESLETGDGIVVQGSLIKNIYLSKPINSKISTQAGAKTGGEGSGG